MTPQTCLPHQTFTETNTPLLMIPGPTPLPYAVMEAMGRPAIGHRSPEFKAVLEEVFPRLQWAFQTKNDVMLYTASGTAAMEAAMVNTLNPGDSILVLTCGVFSERWATMGETLGLTVSRLSVPMGEANTVEALEARLAEPDASTFKAIIITHSETSTGVLNPLKALAALIRKNPATQNTLIFVDAVTSLLATEMQTDAWDLDCVMCGSQKGFMIPPGLSFLSVSNRAWDTHKTVKNPGYYFNFTQNKKAQDQMTTAYTPATHLILALNEALKMMAAEGLETIHARHAAWQKQVREGVRALGLTPFVTEDAMATPSVTSIYPPDHMGVDALRKALKQRFGITVADGQKDLKGKIFRIGHLGFISERDVQATLAALKAIL